MGKSSPKTLSSDMVLVIIIVFSLAELGQGCYRRIDYHNQPHHHHYKKPPPKGHGHGYGGGYGHMSHGHGGGYGSHSVGGPPSHGGYGSHSSGGQHAHGGYGMLHHHSGHGMGSHKGYTNGPSHHGAYGGGQAGHDHSGYPPSHNSVGGPKGYPAHGHSIPILGGYNSAHSAHSAGGNDGYGNAMHDLGNGVHSQVGFGHDAGPSHDASYGAPDFGSSHDNSGLKGKRVKYQMYESSHYHDKSPPSSPGYHHSSPYFTQKGYGHSGPYPNTEYSNPVHASMQPPTDSNMYAGLESGGEGRSPLNLDAADTADLIRNAAYDTSKENELAQPLGGSPDAPLTSMEKGDPTMGNFDLNLNYNSEDLPAPFGAFSSPNVVTVNANGRLRKKISSKFRDTQLARSDDAFTSQSQQVLHTAPSGPDYLENDAGAVGGTGSSGSEALIK